MRRVIIILFISCFVTKAFAQKSSLSANAAEFANLLTLNLEASRAVAKNVTINAAMKYNPFEFEKNGYKGGLRNKQLSASIGARYWLWHIYSGWWLSAKGQYQMYNSGGLKDIKTREGNRYGAGLALGYTYMLGTHLNLDFGLGAWTGLDDYRLYACPVCGETLDSGSKWFVLPDNVLIALSYVF